MCLLDQLQASINLVLVKNLAGGAGDQGGQYARGDALLHELHGAVAAQSIDPAWMERIQLPGIVAVDHAAAAGRRLPVGAEPGNADSAVIVGPSSVQHPA